LGHDGARHIERNEAVPEDGRPSSSGNMGINKLTQVLLAQGEELSCVDLAADPRAFNIFPQEMPEWSKHAVTVY
jgi:hypothetical protein